MNLLAETREAIQESGHSPEDVVFIGSRKSGYRCSWDEFERLADVEYDESFGSPKVATDLEFVFSDGSGIWRGEYDGSEWWEFHKPFVEPAESKPITRLTVEGTKRIGWVDLAELHEKPDY